MPAARGVKRTASKAAEEKLAAPSGASSRSKKKPEPKAPLLSGDLKVPKKRGQVFTAGQGDVGQLGLGEDHLEKSKFTRVASLPSTIVDICAGGMHTVVLDKDGNVWTFGCNDEGALGRDTDDNGEWTPSKVTLPGKAVSVSAGDSHTAALLTTAQVFAWGSFRDSHGNMGLTLKGNERKPVEMLPGHRVVQIASGGDHLVMLTDMGQVFTCGCGEQGQLGRVTARSCDRHSRLGLNGLLVPAPLAFSRDKADFEAIWAGTHCTFARRAAKGDIYVWGLNNYQQIGVRRGNPQTVFTPVISEAFAALESDSKWVKIAGGQHHTLAIDDKGQCYSLGRREYGRLGLGESCEDATDMTPIPVLDGKKCISVSCGSATSYAVTDSGEIYAWGMGTSGQLGTGSEDDEVVPKLLNKGELEGHQTIGVSAGGQHTVLLIASDDVVEDEVDEAEKGDAAPRTKVDDEVAMEVDDKDVKSEKSEKEVDEKKGRRAPAKRGRKRSRSSSSTKETKPASKRQNGGSPVPEETAQEVAEVEKEESKEEPQTKSGTSAPETDSKAQQEEKPQPAPEEKQPVQGKEKTDEVDEPQNKKIKLDDNTSGEPTTTATTKPEETKPQEEKKEEEVAEELKEKPVEKMDVDEKLSNGNGGSEEESKPEEVKVKEITPPAPEKEEVEKMETTTEVAAS